MLKMVRQEVFMKYFRTFILGNFLFVLLTCSLVSAQVRQPLVSTTDKCPVCGKIVAQYPNFVAQIVFKDGTYALFDGVKHLMKYYFNLPKYNPAKTPADIAAIFVSDYYSLKAIDGFKAWYVVGSDVYGPNGKELIPFQDESAARKFNHDHKGKGVVQFTDISSDLVKTLD
jgi:copper chaperone NosL